MRLTEAGERPSRRAADLRPVHSFPAARWSARSIIAVLNALTRIPRTPWVATHPRALLARPGFLLGAMQSRSSAARSWTLEGRHERRQDAPCIDRTALSLRSPPERQATSSNIRDPLHRRASLRQRPITPSTSHFRTAREGFGCCRCSEHRTSRRPNPEAPARQLRDPRTLRKLNRPLPPDAESATALTGALLPGRRSRAAR